MKDLSKDPDYVDIQLASFFSLPAGVEALRILEDKLGVKQTVEPAQEVFLRTGVYHPIDPTEMAIRKGRRDAYYLIMNAIERGGSVLQKRARALTDEPEGNRNA